MQGEMGDWELGSRSRLFILLLRADICLVKVSDVSFIIWRSSVTASGGGTWSP